MLKGIKNVTENLSSVIRLNATTHRLRYTHLQEKIARSVWKLATQCRTIQVLFSILIVRTWLARPCSTSAQTVWEDLFRNVRDDLLRILFKSGSNGLSSLYEIKNGIGWHGTRRNSLCRYIGGGGGIL